MIESVKGKVNLIATDALSLGDTKINSSGDRLLQGGSVNIYQTADKNTHTETSTTMKARISGGGLFTALATAAAVIVAKKYVSSLFNDGTNNDPVGKLANNHYLTEGMVKGIGIKAAAAGALFITNNLLGVKNLADARADFKYNSTTSETYSDTKLIGGSGKTQILATEGDLTIGGVTIGGDDGVVMQANNGNVVTYALDEKHTETSAYINTGWQDINVDIFSGKIDVKNEEANSGNLNATLKTTTKAHVAVIDSINGEVTQIAENGGIINIGSDLNVNGSGKVKQLAGDNGIHNLAAEQTKTSIDFNSTINVDISTQLNMSKLLNFAPLRNMLVEDGVNFVADLAINAGLTHAGVSNNAGSNAFSLGSSGASLIRSGTQLADKHYNDAPQVNMLNISGLVGFNELHNNVSATEASKFDSNFSMSLKDEIELKKDDLVKKVDKISKIKSKIKENTDNCKGRQCYGLMTRTNDSLNAQLKVAEADLDGIGMVGGSTANAQVGKITETTTIKTTYELADPERQIGTDKVPRIREVPVDPTTKIVVHGTKTVPADPKTELPIESEARAREIAEQKGFDVTGMTYNPKNQTFSRPSSSSNYLKDIAGYNNRDGLFEARSNALLDLASKVTGKSNIELLSNAGVVSKNTSRIESVTEGEGANARIKYFAVDAKGKKTEINDSNLRFDKNTLPLLKEAGLVDKNTSGIESVEVKDKTGKVTGYEYFQLGSNGKRLSDTSVKLGNSVVKIVQDVLYTKSLKVLSNAVDRQCQGQSVGGKCTIEIRQDDGTIVKQVVDIKRVCQGSGDGSGCMNQLFTLSNTNDGVKQPDVKDAKNGKTNTPPEEVTVTDNCGLNSNHPSCKHEEPTTEESPCAKHQDDPRCKSGTEIVYEEVAIKCKDKPPNYPGCEPKVKTEVTEPTKVLEKPKSDYVAKDWHQIYNFGKSVTDGMGSGSTIGDLMGDLNVSITGKADIKGTTETTYRGTRIGNNKYGSYYNVVTTGDYISAGTTVNVDKSKVSADVKGATQISAVQNSVKNFSTDKFDISLTANLTADSMKKLIDGLLPNEGGKVTGSTPNTTINGLDGKINFSTGVINGTYTNTHLSSGINSTDIFTNNSKWKSEGPSTITDLSKMKKGTDTITFQGSASANANLNSLSYNNGQIGIGGGLWFGFKHSQCPKCRAPNVQRHSYSKYQKC